MLSAQQRQFFETFGYLHLRGAIAADVGWISDEFHAGWKSQGVEHDGTKHTGYPGIMISSTPRLSTLLDHAAVVGALDDLLGQGWSCYGGDGNFYYGDTQWHSDVHPGTVSEKGITRHIKIAFYLDAIRLGHTGCLRVIPGSHLGGDRYSTLVQDGLCGGAPLGLSGRDVPAAALETDPGDLVVFDHRLKHAAFGGGNARPHVHHQRLRAPVRPSESARQCEWSCASTATRRRWIGWRGPNGGTGSIRCRPRLSSASSPPSTSEPKSCPRRRRSAADRGEARRHRHEVMFRHHLAISCSDSRSQCRSSPRLMSSLGTRSTCPSVPIGRAARLSMLDWFTHSRNTASSTSEAAADLQLLCY